jgi:short-subunit dehydrogenase
LSESLRRELLVHGIDVILVVPGASEPGRGRCAAEAL